MSKQALEFGSFLADEAFKRYVVSDDESEFSEDDITDLFIKFTKTQQKEQLDQESYVKSWIDEWLTLFPKGVKSGGKLIRSDKGMCLKKMIKFIRETGFDRDVIFSATKDYLRERALNDYSYTKCATYFISKEGEGSELAARCANVTDEQINDEETRLEFDEFI